MGSMLQYYFDKFFLLHATPTLIVLPIWIVGIILSLRFRNQDRKKFTLTLVAFTIFLTESIASIFITMLLFTNVSSAIISSEQQAIYSEVLNWISILFRSVAWLILFGAFLTRRFSTVANA